MRRLNTWSKRKTCHRTRRGSLCVATEMTGAKSTTPPSPTRTSSRLRIRAHAIAPISFPLVYISLFEYAAVLMDRLGRRLFRQSPNKSGAGHPPGRSVMPKCERARSLTGNGLSIGTCENAGFSGTPAGRRWQTHPDAARSARRLPIERLPCRNVPLAIAWKTLAPTSPIMNPGTNAIGDGFPSEGTATTNAEQCLNF